MDTWSYVYRKVVAAVKAMGADIIFYRGHPNSHWKLLPGLARVPRSVVRRYRPPDINSLEQNLYYDFVAGGGDLVPQSNNSWDNVFLMQHHGLPTRLLDWSESFSIALFFALKTTPTNPSVWLLNPYALNGSGFGNEITDAGELGGGYDEYFLTRSKVFPAAVAAIRPTKHARRLAQQQAMFTLHRNLSTSLDKLHPEALCKIEIPPSAVEGGRRFLRLAGMTEYALFPDLDGLARHLKTRLLSRSA